MSSVKLSAIVIISTVLLAAACSDAGSDAGRAMSGAGTADGGAEPGPGGGRGGVNTGGASPQGTGGSSAMTSSGSGGAPGGTGSTQAGAGGVSSAGEGQGGAGAAGEGGGSGSVVIDPRKGCETAHLIEVSLLQVLEQAGPGEQALLSVDVRNGTGKFLSGSGILFTCDNDAIVESAQDYFQKFGILEGGSEPVDLRVQFRDTAEVGQKTKCTVVTQPSHLSPDDCSNANRLSIDVTVL